MAEQIPLHFVFYIAAPPDKVWEAFVSPNPTAFCLWEPNWKLIQSPEAP